jgi:hypothetical protein
VARTGPPLPFSGAVGPHRPGEVSGSGKLNGRYTFAELGRSVSHILAMRILTFGPPRGDAGGGAVWALAAARRANSQRREQQACEHLSPYALDHRIIDR